MNQLVKILDTALKIASVAAPLVPVPEAGLIGKGLGLLDDIVASEVNRTGKTAEQIYQDAGVGFADDIAQLKVDIAKGGD